MCIGALHLYDQNLPIGLAFLLFGAGVLLYGVWFLPDRLRRGELAFLLIGGRALQLGVSMLIEGDDPAQAIEFLMLGIGGVLGGVSFLIARLRLFGVAFLVFSVSGLVLGIGCMQEQFNIAGFSGELVALIGVPLMLFGVASLLTGFALLYSAELGHRVLVWLTARDGAPVAATGVSGDVQESHETPHT